MMGYSSVKGGELIVHQKQRSFLPKARNHDDGKWLYLLQHKNGWVKVGITRKPRERMLVHNSNKLCGEVLWVHLFEFSKDCRKRECIAINALSKLSSEVKFREYFVGITDKMLAIRSIREAIINHT